MSRRGYRLAAVTALGSTLLALSLLLLAYLIARSVLPASVAAGTLDALRERFLGWGIVLLTAVALLGAAAGRALERELHGARRLLVQRVRGAAAVAPEQGRLRELRALGLAAERLADELQRRALAIEEQRSTLAVLVDAVSEGLLRIDGAGRIVFANPAARGMLELLPSALGQNHAAVVRSRELRELIQRALAGERVAGTELDIGERRILVSAQPIDAADASMGAGLALADLTTLRRLEGVRRDFVANASHELKTPLTSIRGYAETLLHDDVPADLRQQFLQVVLQNAESLQHIVDDLLDLSRIESGGWRPELEPVDAQEVVHEAWLGCADVASRRGIRFDPPAAGTRVLADRRALRQVLTNLFDNALRHTTAGGHVQVRITPLPATGVPPGGRRVLLEVQDNGSGIPGDALPRIFERFYRVDPARSRAEGGTGLGLAIVKHLIESMGGDVTAESALGRGTTIRLRLPAAP